MTTSWPRKLRRWFLAGLIFLAPLFVTWLAVSWLFRKLDSPIRSLVHGSVLDIPGVGVICTLLIILLCGAVASNFLVKNVVGWLEAALDNIPGVRSLYGGVKKLVAPLSEEHSGTFQKVVMVRFPDEHTYSLGFLIKPNVGLSPTGELLSAVLVPTNHLHLGHVILTPTSELHSVNLSAEEGLEFLVSMGAALDRKLSFGPPPEIKVT